MLSENERCTQENRMNTKISKTIYFILSSSLLLFAFFVVFLATKWGIGLTPDSITYIQGARGILKNIDFAGLGTHYPPFYFILLAFTGLFFESIIISARYLHIFIFVINAFLFSYLLKSKTKSQWLFLLGLSVFISAPVTFKTHVMAWSEPFFVTCLLCNFHFISEYLWKRQNKHLMLAAIFAALAILTRYAGVTLIITCLLIIITESRRCLKERIKNTVYFAVISGLPMFFWLLRNELTQQQITSRSFVLHMISFENIQQCLETIYGWFFLSPDNGYLLAVLVMISGWVYWRYYFKDSGEKNTGNYQLLKVSMTFAVVYIAFLFISKSFFDAYIPFDQRILLPVFLCLMLIIIILFKKSSDNFSAFTRTVLILFACMFVSVQMIITQKNLAFFVDQGIMYNGVGYSTKIWVTSKTVYYARSLPKHAVIYTNAPDVLNLFLDRPSRMIPYFMNPLDRVRNQEFSAQLENMIADIKSQNGYLIYFVNINWRWYLPSLQMLVQSLQGFTLYQTEDGFIFSPPKNNVY